MFYIVVLHMLPCVPILERLKIIVLCSRLMALKRMGIVDNYEVSTLRCMNNLCQLKISFSVDFKL